MERVVGWQESDYAGRMRDEKYEQELKVQKANQRIFELQRTNEQMGRLLSKIPPEVQDKSGDSVYPCKLGSTDTPLSRNDFIAVAVLFRAPFPCGGG